MANNLLCAAIAAREQEFDALADVVWSVFGEATAEEHLEDDRLWDAASDLITRAEQAVETLTPRARHARLNLMLKDFQRTWRNKLAKAA